MQKIKKIMKYIATLPILLKTLTLMMTMAFVIGMLSLGFVFLDWLHEIFSAPITSKTVYDTFEIEDVKELVVIKKSEDDSGYYLDFIEDIDQKLEEVIDSTYRGVGTHKLPKDKEFLKKLLKAEVITQFPDLGGNIPEDSDGFQGTVAIRRVTPNKEMGSITDNPGKGETSNIEPEITYDTIDNAILEEGIVKTWSEGQALVLIDNAKVYAQRESELNPGSDTGSWYVVKKEGASSEDLIIEEGTEVIYTGTYKKSENVLNNSLSKIYIEVKEGDFTGYISASLVEEKQNKKENQQTKKTTSRANETEREKEEIIGKEGETYTIAIAAGHNNTDNKGARNGDLVEEELTIKTAEKVEKLLNKYSNVKVVQVGSTSSNPGGIKMKERTKKAKEANPDLCIQIHYNAGNGTGVEAIYKNGDGRSRQLAEILSETIANTMGLPNREEGTDIEKCGKNLGIIENSTTSGFPSVVTEGGFIDGDPDAKLLKEDGVDKYAQGIVEGIKKYLIADHTGYTATNITNQTAQESVDSKVYNLKYVDPQELEEILKKANEGDGDAKNRILKIYTLDENHNLITVTWKTDAGNVAYQKNTPISLATSLAKYVMPYEYLLYYYIDSKETEFSERLADEIINGTEIVIAVQDNISTTQTVENKIQWTEATDEEYSKPEEVVETTTTMIENCNPKIEVTYADTWFVKFYKENSYSNKALDWGEDEEKEIDIKGKVNQSSSSSETSGEVIDSGTYEKTEEKDIINEDGDKEKKEVTTNVEWITYEKTKTDMDNMTITYDSGEATIEGNERKFVQIYQDTHMQQWVRVEKYLLKIIEDNEKTANLLDLTKYLIYKATDEYYGVVEFNFSEFGGNFQNNGSGDYYGNTFEEKVWWALLDAGYSKEAAAGAMGNFKQESGFEANNLQDTYEEKWGVTDESYTEEVNNGSRNFIDKGGYGLAQWTSDGRKKGLYDLAMSKGVGVDNEEVQIEFLLFEMSEEGGGFSPSEGRALFMRSSISRRSIRFIF